MSSLTGKSLNPVMNRRSVIASAAGLGAMSILAGCSSNGGDSGSASGDASFKIGTIGPLTGANASYGKSVTQGVELGCKDFSTKELPLASKAEDDQADGEKAVNAFNTLLDWGMQALVGPTTTGASVAVAAECGNDPKTFMITPSASSEDVTDGKDCVFQVCFTDPNQGVNAAKFLAQKYADEKFVLFYNSGDAYSSGIADSFKAQAAESKLEIVDEETFNKGTVTEKRALTGVDLTLNDGDFVTVIGGNGAGKSTLLNMIAGVYPLDSGVIELDGTDISRLSESQRAKYLGRVFQDPMRGTAADMQIAENLALAKRRGQRRGLSWGVTKAEKDEYVELLKRLDLGLDTRLNAKVGLLSGGQRQALTLLMATLTKPRLLLLDEHTAALDPKTASKVLNLTEEIVDENHLTTLMVTHNMNDAIRLGNRLIMMHEGHVIYDVAGDEKKSLTVADLLQKFEEVSGGELANDRMLLS